MGKKFSKLGLWLGIINSVAVITFCYIDTMNAIQCGSSGFALIPLIIMDTPATFMALPLAGLMIRVILPFIPLDNTSFNSNLYVVIQKTIFAVPFLLLGGLQWYGIGWLITKFKQRFFTRSKAKR